MTAREFIDLVVPEHGRTSCSDEDRSNGFFTRGNGDKWHGRCTRCMYLEILDEGVVPKGFEHYEGMG